MYHVPYTLYVHTLRSGSNGTAKMCICTYTHMHAHMQTYSHSRYIYTQNQVGRKSRKVEAQEEQQRSTEEACQERQKQLGECQQDLTVTLSMAKPMVATATKALKNIDKADLARIKAYTTPPPAVETVFSAVLLLSSPPGNLASDVSWTRAKRAMSSIDRFLIELLQVCA
jgi:hypothetical protein